MKLTINNNEIELKYSFRALMMFENITDKTIELNTLGDILTFFYCVVCASNRNIEITFDSFIDWLDDNPTAVVEFREWITDQMIKNSMLKKSPVEPVKKAKSKK